MQLSETIKLYLNNNQKTLILNTMKEYVATVNRLLELADNGTSISKYSTKDFVSDMPAALKNQALRDAKSIYNKYKKIKRLSFL